MAAAVTARRRQSLTALGSAALAAATLLAAGCRSAGQTSDPTRPADARPAADAPAGPPDSDAMNPEQTTSLVAEDAAAFRPRPAPTPARSAPTRPQSPTRRATDAP